MPGDQWLQNMMRNEGRSEGFIQSSLKQHYADGGLRTLPQPSIPKTGPIPGMPDVPRLYKTPAELATVAAKGPPALKPNPSWLRRAGKALKFLK